jgi:hypothetical protein
MSNFTDQEYGVRLKGSTKEDDILVVPSMKSVNWWLENTTKELEVLVRDITFMMGRKWDGVWKPYVAPEVEPTLALTADEVMVARSWHPYAQREGWHFPEAEDVLTKINSFLDSVDDTNG